MFFISFFKHGFVLRSFISYLNLSVVALSTISCLVTLMINFFYPFVNVKYCFINYVYLCTSLLKY